MAGIFRPFLGRSQRKLARALRSLFVPLKLHHANIATYLSFSLALYLHSLYDNRVQLLASVTSHATCSQGLQGKQLLTMVVGLQMKTQKIAGSGVAKFVLSVFQVLFCFGRTGQGWALLPTC